MRACGVSKYDGEMTVLLYVVLMLPIAVGDMSGRPSKPILHEIPMPNVFACMAEVNHLLTHAAANWKSGTIQAGCVLIGAEKEQKL